MGTTFDEVTTLGDVSAFLFQENRNLFLAMPFTSSGMRTLAKLFEYKHIFGDEPYSEILGSLARRLHWKFTVAVLAQGTSWAVAVTQAFLGLGSIPSYAAARTSNGFSLQLSTT